MEVVKTSVATAPPENRHGNVNKKLYLKFFGFKNKMEKGKEESLWRYRCWFCPLRAVAYHCWVAEHELLVCDLQR